MRDGMGWVGRRRMGWGGEGDEGKYAVILFLSPSFSLCVCAN